MKRDTAINVMLVIAGIVLAIALFGAGVLWKREAAKSPKSLSSADVFRSENCVGHHAMNTRYEFAVYAYRVAKPGRGRSVNCPDGRQLGSYPSVASGSGVPLLFSTAFHIQKSQFL